MKSMLQLIRELTPLNRAVCSVGYDEAVACLCDQLPFGVIAVPDHVRHNGWVIPPSWDIEEAKIRRDNEIVYDGASHPLSVISLSSSYAGSVPLNELKRHLFFDHRDDESIPFHYRQQFRCWERDWGFCMPKRILDELTGGHYEVSIRTRESRGAVKILEYKHRGQTDLTIALGANLDHAGVANDGLSGCVVGLEVMRRIANRKTKLTYSLVLSPGILGSELYLASMPEHARSQILEGIFLEMLGTENSLAVQESRHSMVSVSHALRASLEAQSIQYRRGEFEEFIINDEYIWENYKIPMLSLSRFPYPEYHSSRDNLTIIREAALIEAVNAIVGMIDQLEASPIVVKRFQGNMCLSNPIYDLYVDYGQVALGDRSSAQQRRMRALMDFIPSLERPASIAAIAAQVGLNEEVAHEYMLKWSAKGLVELL